jgi:hypothetical protein
MAIIRQLKRINIGRLLSVIAIGDVVNLGQTPPPRRDEGHRTMRLD